MDGWLSIFHNLLNPSAEWHRRRLWNEENQSQWKLIQFNRWINMKVIFKHFIDTIVFVSISISISVGRSWNDDDGQARICWCVCYVLVRRIEIITNGKSDLFDDKLNPNTRFKFQYDSDASVHLSPDIFPENIYFLCQLRQHCNATDVEWWMWS